jgi:hypothetical protein
VHLNTSFEAKMLPLPRGDNSRPTFLTSDVFRPLEPSLYERHTGGRGCAKNPAKRFLVL